MAKLLILFLANLLHSQKKLVVIIYAFALKRYFWQQFLFCLKKSAYTHNNTQTYMQRSLMYCSRQMLVMASMG